MVSGLLSIGVIDVLDILLVAFIVYWVLLFIRGRGPSRSFSAC